MFTDEQLASAAMSPLARAARWGGVLRTAMSRNGITTKRRAAHFIGQLGHESSGFTRLEENLSYSAARLLEVFPKYFNERTATEYARQPQRIANHVYANREGNGSESSGDGWRYRGRGLIQVTLKNNYRRLAVLLELPLLECPQLLIEPEHAANASATWWRDNSLNALADSGDILAVSRRINLGNANSRSTPHGLQDRINRTRRAVAAFGA